MRRIEAICSLIEPVAVIADVGCDHGKVAEYCLNNNLANTVIASDISAESLQKAKSLLGSRDNISFVVCDGIGFACDEAVIAGMGGYTIADIISAATVLPQTLVLCPHRDAYVVRKKLCDCGYSIDRDFICSERGKYYSVMRARRGGAKELSELQLRFGAHYVTDSSMLDEQLRKLRVAYLRAPAHNQAEIQAIEAALDARRVSRK